MSLRVHLYRINFAEHADEFKSLLDPDIVITEDDTIPEPADFEILVHPTPSKEWLEANPALTTVIVPWAGVPKETLEVMREFPKIALHNLHYNSFNTAELGFSLLLAAAKLIVPIDQAMRKNDWDIGDKKHRVLLLRGKTALILGFGGIGQALCTYCLGLGMKVIVIKRYPEKTQTDLDVEIFATDKLHEILPEADVLLIALPLTPETKGLIGETELALMPAGGILVNIGRGPIVDQYALYDALTGGHLRAAASDVWYNYPKTRQARSNTPPADVPFCDLENFVLSPHRGELTEGVKQQLAESLSNLLNAANRGQPLPNKVDRDAGY